MADATVSVTSGRVASFLDLSAVLITVTYDATAYATATGGLPFDLYSTLQAVSPFSADIDYRDIIGFLPLGTTTEKFVVAGNTFAVGTVTDTTIPCTIRLYGTGSGEKAAFTEVDNAALTGSFKGLLLIARG
jgi:endonuclease YncB( thermonuclease family)